MFMPLCRRLLHQTGMEWTERERDREIQYQIQKIGSERKARGNDGAIDCQMKRKMGGRTIDGSWWGEQATILWTPHATFNTTQRPC